jgi:hypothetical protein
VDHRAADHHDQYPDFISNMDARETRLRGRFEPASIGLRIFLVFTIDDILAANLHFLFWHWIYKIYIFLILLVSVPCYASLSSTTMNKTAIVLEKKVGSKILVLRNQRVILDSDLAELYGVPVRQLNQQVKRNLNRFPADFLFALTSAEHQRLRSQIVISNVGRGGRRYLPKAFTEHGAIMAATVLNSKRAIDMSVFIVRAFVRMRDALALSHNIETKLSELERRLDSYDADIQDVVEAIRELMAPLPANNRRIGFERPAAPLKSQSRSLKAAKA